MSLYAFMTYVPLQYKYLLDILGLGGEITQDSKNIPSYGIRGKWITIPYKEHKIDIQFSSFTGKENVVYDGSLVSSKRSIRGATHIFNVKEGGKNVKYEVKIFLMGLPFFSSKLWVTVHRNGQVIWTGNPYDLS